MSRWVSRGFGLWALLLTAACSGRDQTLLITESPLEESGGAGTTGGDESTGAGASDPGMAEGQVGPPDSIFEREHVVEVRVEMDPRDWEVLSFEGIGMAEILFPESGYSQVPPYTRFAATVTVDGVSYEDVEIRKKGYIGSLSVIRPSLKLDFERRRERELVAGNRRMTLNNDAQDPSHLRQCLSYDMFHAIGLPAPRCNYAHVVVNGVDLGTYTHVEAIRRPMLRRYFGDVDGNLYEGQLSDFTPETAEHLELETNEARNDRSDVEAVIAALAAPDERLLEALGEVIDLDNFFDFWALETLLGHWDGYSGGANNFFAYHDPVSDKFFFIPWGTDQTFVGDNPNDGLPYQVSVYALGAIANRLYALPGPRARYRQRLGELNDTLWDVPKLLEQVDALVRLAPGASGEAVTRLRSYIRHHGEELRSALAAPAPDWPEAPPPGPADPCTGTISELSGAFEVTWGTIANGAVLQNGSPSVSVAMNIDGRPFAGEFRGGAGEDGFLGLAALQFWADSGGGAYYNLELGMPVELFEPGYHPLHSFESFGGLGLIDPSSGGFALLGLIGDGYVELEQASLQPGGAVVGTFSAQISHFLCASTALAFPPFAELEVPAPGE